VEPYEVLEQEWARWNGLNPAGMVVCASGTAALHLAFEALRLPPGSEVLCPDYTMVACPRAIVAAGLTPVFVDCRADNLLMDWDHVTDGNHRAVLSVAIYGRRPRYPGWYENCDAGFYLIEDLAEAHGQIPHRYAAAACWSFYRNKAIAGEEGGAVWFRDPARAAMARQLRTLGFTEAHDYTHVPRGWNHRLSNAHARLVLESLRNADHNLPARRRIEQWYYAACPPEWRQPPRDRVWVYDVRIPGLMRDRQSRIVKALNAVGIAGRMGFWPMSCQEEFRRCNVLACSDNGAKQALRAAHEVFYLPVQPGITTEESVGRAFAAIKAIK